MAETRFKIWENGPEAAAERNVPRNPRPLCEDFVAQAEPAEFWCATCKWNRPMHDMPEHRAAIAAELERLASAPRASLPPGEHVNCAHDPDSTATDMLSAMICSPLPEGGADRG